MKRAFGLDFRSHGGSKIEIIVKQNEGFVELQIDQNNEHSVDFVLQREIAIEFAAAILSAVNFCDVHPDAEAEGRATAPYWPSPSAPANPYLPVKAPSEEFTLTSRDRAGFVAYDALNDEQKAVVNMGATIAFPEVRVGETVLMFSQAFDFVEAGTKARDIPMYKPHFEMLGGDLTGSWQRISIPKAPAYSTPRTDRYGLVNLHGLGDRERAAITRRVLIQPHSHKLASLCTCDDFDLVPLGAGIEAIPTYWPIFNTDAGGALTVEWRKGGFKPNE